MSSKRDWWRQLVPNRRGVCSCVCSWCARVCSRRYRADTKEGKASSGESLAELQSRTQTAAEGVDLSALLETSLAQQKAETLAHLEHQIAAALLLQSRHEVRILFTSLRADAVVRASGSHTSCRRVVGAAMQYRYWVHTYAGYLATEALLTRLEELCASLLGPPSRYGPSSSPPPPPSRGPGHHQPPPPPPPAGRPASTGGGGCWLDTDVVFTTPHAHRGVRAPSQVVHRGGSVQPLRRGHLGADGAGAFPHPPAPPTNTPLPLYPTQCGYGGGGGGPARPPARSLVCHSVIHPCPSLAHPSYPVRCACLLHCRA
jgi:hypothetical protein